MEVVRISECSENMEFKYEVTFPYYTDSVELVDGSRIPTVLLTRYYKNNEGEWERCTTNASKFVTVDALLSNYVAIDSPVYKHIMDSNSIVKQYRYEKLNDTLKVYTGFLGDPETPQAYENLEPQANEESVYDDKASNIQC